MARLFKLLATAAAVGFLFAGASTKAPAGDNNVALGFASLEAYHVNCVQLSTDELAAMVLAEPDEQSMKPARSLVEGVLGVFGKDRFCRELKPAADLALVKVRKAMGKL